MRVEFPKGLEEAENLPKTRRILQNCFNNGKGQVFSRPGISQLSTTDRVARGAFVWNGSLYVVATNDLLKVTNLNTGAFSDIGDIAGSAQIRVAIGFNDAVIVVQGGATYTLDSSDTLTDVSGNSNFVPFRDVAHIDNRFVYIPADGSPAKVSAVGDAATIGATSFFDAEDLPDANRAVIAHKGTLYILGENSVEPFNGTGATPVPFTRISRGRLQYGIHGGLLSYGESFLFIGKEEGQDVGVYAVSGGRAEKISNEFIDRILIQYTPEELQEAIPGRVNWRGYNLATFALRRHSFGFYGGQWFLLDTIIGGRSRPWGAGYIASIGNEYYTAYSDKIGKFVKGSTDYGERVTKTIDFAFEQENRDYFSCQSIELGISQGYNAAVGSVAIMMSRNNIEYGPALYQNLGALAKYGNRLIWNPPGGLGTYPGFMGVRIYTTEAVDFSADSIIARIRV